MNELVQDIVRHPLPSLFIIGNLVLIESLLSVDNAAVLATLVADLPGTQRGKALRYGIVGAYLFRGLALVFAAFLIRVWWLKPLGGLYLLYLFVDFLRRVAREQTGKTPKKRQNKTRIAPAERMLGKFWSTVLLIEVMDVAFSMDNVFAAVAFTPNILLVCAGVFMGIFAMRFVAHWFVTLIERFPFLETSAFLVIGLLGIKLTASVFFHFFPQNSFSLLAVSSQADAVTSMFTIAIFSLPLISSFLFNFPKRREMSQDQPPKNG